MQMQFQVLHDLCMALEIAFDIDSELPAEAELKICRVSDCTGKVVFYESYAEFDTMKEAVNYLL